MRAPAMQAARASLRMRTFSSMPARVAKETPKWNLKKWASLGAGATGLALCVSEPSRADGAAAMPFSLGGSKYDMSTFMGRTLAFYEVIDPRHLLVGQAEIDKAKALLEDYKKAGNKAPAGVTDEQLWEAKTCIDINCHPVTGEALFAPGRMSAFVPANVPIVIFMTMASGAPMIALSQVTNQTYNVVCNYVNRSGVEVDFMALGKSYLLAVSSAITIAVTGNKLVGAIPALQSLGILVPYSAVAMAGSANLAFTRMDEWNGRGTPVKDADGKEAGFSLAAGKTAVMQTVISRCLLLPIVPMVLPGLVCKAAGITGFGPKLAAELVLVITAYVGVMPACLAVLPPTMELDVKDLEPEFHNLVDKKGAPITKVYGNKGL